MRNPSAMPVVPAGGRMQGPADDGEQVGCTKYFKDAGGKTEKWVYVGDGRGSFNEVNSYNYIGRGHGGWEQEVKTTPMSFSRAAIFLGVGGLVLLILVAVACKAWVDHRAQPYAPAQQAAQMGAAQNCQDGLQSWATSWTEEKKLWCCASEQKGCKPVLQGCATECDYMSKKASCSFRTQWGANHRFKHQAGSCLQAHQMVMEQCPYCVEAGCSAQSVSCKPS